MGKIRLPAHGTLPPRDCDDGSTGKRATLVPLTFAEDGPLGLQLGWHFEQSRIVLTGVVPHSQVRHQLQWAVRALDCAGPRALIVIAIARRDAQAERIVLSSPALGVVGGEGPLVLLVRLPLATIAAAMRRSRQELLISVLHYVCRCRSTSRVSPSRGEHMRRC